MGRPLPGSAEVKVAAFDRVARSLELGPDGLGRECATDEVGLLVARVNPGESIAGNPLRGVFTGGDAWRSSGDLFLRDEHNDLWLVDPVSALIPTAGGPVMPAGTRMALGTIPAVDLMVAYGVADGDAESLVAAVTLRPGAALSAADLDRAFDRLPASHRPSYVQVVRSIPVTTWHRPIWRPLQQAGIPKPARTRKVWKLGEDRAHYEQLKAE
jgi:putative long chain acyl-CoA synthase